VGRAAEEDAFAREVDGAQFDVRLEEEALGGERHLEELRELSSAVGRYRRRGEDEQVDGHRHVLAEVGVAEADRDRAVGADLGLRLLVVTREDHAQLARLRVVLLEEAEGADLLEPHVDRTVGVALLEGDGVLDALLAAGARAVGPALVERARAEDEADGAGLGERRVVLLEHALQVHAGDDLGARAQAVEVGALLLRPGGDDDDAVVDGGPLAVLLTDDA